MDDRSGGTRKPPMRSSIACQRCRSSKIKCHNQGAHAPCETCIRSGRECVYPDATSQMQPKRPKPPTTPKLQSEVPAERKRPKRHDEAARFDGQAEADEVLSASFLGQKTWSELLDSFRLHFAAELPFLHLATLKDNIGIRVRRQKDQKDTSSAASHDINLVLLGILTLTARFHPTVVSYVANIKTVAAHNQRQKPSQAQDATNASEYYANALTSALGGLRVFMTTASVERVQACLMLGLFEWSQAEARDTLGAWNYIGLAIRMAQPLGLGSGDRPADQSHLSIEETITKEIKRRTMFSCLVLDRMLGCGKDRAHTIRSEDLTIQLPCSEHAFDLARDVHTGFLQPSPADPERPISDESVLERFVRLVDIWGDICKWTSAGGRFTDTLPPWHEHSAYHKLRRRFVAFKQDLPGVFTWSTSNYHRHENHQASGVFVSLHMLSALCVITLHREWLPFVPVRCKKPVGPLDEPTFAQCTESRSFWDQSAAELFGASRDIVDLIDICRDHKLPMSALVLYAVWNAALMGLYAMHFPHMDTTGFMLQSGARGSRSHASDDGEDGDDEDDELQLQKHGDATQDGPTGLTYRTLTHMASWLKPASSYIRRFHYMDQYYTKLKQHFERQEQASRGGDDELRTETGENGVILGEDDKPPSPTGTPTGDKGSSVSRDKTGKSERGSFKAINSSSQHGRLAPRPPQTQNLHLLGGAATAHAGTSPSPVDSEEHVSQWSFVMGNNMLISGIDEEEDLAFMGVFWDESGPATKSPRQSLHGGKDC